MNDYDKECHWTVPHPLEAEYWRKHAKGQIIAKYADRLTGAVADFGCNNAIACSILSALPGVDSVTGFDLYEAALREGITVLRGFPGAQPQKVKLVCCNLAAIYSPPAAFDAGICFHTMEHIYPDDLDTVVQELSRVIIPGGCLVFSVPCRKAFANAKTHMCQFSPGPEAGYTDLSAVLTRNGFTVEDIYEDATLPHALERCITGVAVVLDAGGKSC